MSSWVLRLSVALLAGSILATYSPPSGATSIADESKALVPERDIIYVSSQSVAWKDSWDKGRAFSRQGEYDLALAAYTQLLQEKPRLEEARWEYGTILFHVGRLKDAGSQFDILVRANPDKRKYLLAQAEVAHKTGKLQLAVKRYGQLYVQSPVGAFSVEALRGLIDALEAQGKYNVLVPLMEQYLLRSPHDHGMRKRLAMVALSRNNLAKALPLLEKLHTDNPSDFLLLKDLASIYDRVGKGDRARLLWLEVAQQSPGDLDVHKALAGYYKREGNITRQIFHVERLLKHDPADHENLVLIADLYLENGQANKAVDYYTLYTDLFPEDRSVSQKKRGRAGQFCKRTAWPG